VEKRYKKSRLATLMSLILAGISHGIYAQEEETTTEQESNNAKLEVIQVTTQKRTQSLQEVPITVNAINGDTLDKFGVDNLFEIADLTPGLVFSRAPDDGLALTLRGLGTPARTQSFDQSVALFLDGMFVGKGRMYSASFFDVERVEVIKGTQSTLLGKNTSLGAISLATKKPGDTLSGYAQGAAEFENGGYSFDGAIDVPISQDFAVRFATRVSEQEGSVRNLATERDVPDDSNFGFRATAVYTPSNTLTLTAAYQHSDSERIGNAFQFVDNGNFIPDEVIALIGEVDFDDTKTALCEECPNGESFHDTEVDSFTVTLEKDFDNFSLTSITSYATYEIDFFDDFDFGLALDELTFLTTGETEFSSTFFERVEDYAQQSQEFRITSTTDTNIDYIAGLFYFQSDWDSSEIQNFRTPNFPPPDPGQLFNGTFTNNFIQETSTISIYGQSTYHLSDKLRATLGLRYTSEDKDVVFDRIQGEPTTLFNTVINPPFESDLTFDDQFLNGNFNVQYDLSRTARFYASYGLGTKTGGFAESAEVSSADPSLNVNEGGAAVESEEAQTYELGSKLTLLDGSMNLNLAVFKTDISDFQETSFQVTGNSAAFLTRNIDVESEGFEIDGKWQATSSLQLNGGVTYADSVNADDGSQLAQAPKVTGVLGFIHDYDLGSSGMTLSSRGFVRYRDDMVSQINETFPSDSLTTVNFNIGVRNSTDVWGLELIVTNLFNERSADFSGPPAAPIGALFGAPPGDQGITAESLNEQRTVKLQFRYDFY
jgi:iron complex outermembrane receptor protein